MSGEGTSVRMECNIGGCTNYRKRGIAASHISAANLVKHIKAYDIMDHVKDSVLLVLLVMAGGIEPPSDLSTLFSSQKPKLKKNAI